MLAFVRWYNMQHKHRNLKFVSPAERYTGADSAIFAKRIAVHEAVRGRHRRAFARIADTDITHLSGSLPALNRVALDIPRKRGVGCIKDEERSRNGVTCIYKHSAAISS